MENTAILPIEHHHSESQITSEIIKAFYDEATEDYAFWSNDFNMHFGFHIWGKTNPLKRDTMLNEMNRQILNRLQLSTHKQLVADLGCGMGGTMRYFLQHRKNISAIGVTISDFQVSEGNKRLDGLNGIIVKENFCKTTIGSNKVDGAVAIESFCHAGHNQDSLKEAYRILKPGARLIIGDAFLKKAPEQLSLGARCGYHGICNCWSLDGLGIIQDILRKLKALGFKSVTAEDISLHVAPSVLHVPFAIPSFIFKQKMNRKPIKKQSWNNLKASFYALLAGLHMNDFGYYLITAEK